MFTMNWASFLSRVQVRDTLVNPFTFLSWSSIREASLSRTLGSGPLIMTSTGAEMLERGVAPKS